MDFHWSYRTRKLFKIATSIFINIPHNEVLDRIKSPDFLSLSHPFCRNHESIGFRAIGDIDYGEYCSGVRLKRELVTWVGEEGYVLKVKIQNNTGVGWSEL